MAYEKRVCVLKQIKRGFSADGSVLSGAVYAERLGDELTIIPKLAGIAPLSEGRYCLAVWVSGRIFCLEFQPSIKIEKAPTLTRGVSVLLCYVRGEAEPVAYGGCGEAPRDYGALLAAISGTEEEKPAKRKRQIPATNPPLQTPAPAPNVPVGPSVPVPEPIPEETAQAENGEEEEHPFRGKYCDDAIAESDYFAISSGDEDAYAASAGEEKEGARAGGEGAQENGEPPHPATRGSLTYYYEVKEKLDEAFKKFPSDERLKAIFPRSEWVNSEGALLGVIYEEGIPRYLCVAVEALEAPPEEIKERGVFVPKTQFSDKEGFYVVFQDADTGEYVRVYDA